MIKGFVQGQTLKLAQTRVVADSIDYLIAKFHFQGEDWRDLEKWMHLQQGEQLYVIKLTNDRTQKSDHLNLGAGEWAVWLHGNETVDGVVTQRITTNICAFTVERSGALEGDAMPELPASVGEQLSARIKALEEQGEVLPLIGEDDEGKVLTVVGGQWQAADAASGGADITVDTELSETSENPVQNKVIAAALEGQVAQATKNAAAISENAAAISQNTAAISNNAAAIAAQAAAVKEALDDADAAFADVYEKLGNVSATVPSFDLVSLGLPVVPMDGRKVQLLTDTSAIMAALDKGAVKFIARYAVGANEIPAEIVMNKISIFGGGTYVCSYAVDFEGMPMIFNLNIVDGALVAFFTPLGQGGGASVATFDLAGMGLPVITLGNNPEVLVTDTTEIVEALGRGPVKFIVQTNFTGQTLNAEIVVSGVGIGGSYVCTYVFDLMSTTVTFNAIVDAGSILVYLAPLNAAGGGASLPTVSATDNGKVLQVVDGAAAWVSVADSSIKTYIDDYINEALGGDY